MNKHNVKVGDTLYRMYDVVYAPMVDEYGFSAGEGKVALQMHQLCGTRVTLHGAWVNYCCVPKFVKLTGRRSFAYPTVDLAIESFKIRKRRQMMHLSRQLNRARTALALVDGFSTTLCSLVDL